jgi:hypothetical protein
MEKIAYFMMENVEPDRGKYYFSSNPSLNMQINK